MYQSTIGIYKKETRLVESASNEPAIKGLGCMEEEISKPATEKTNKKVDYYRDNMRHGVAMCKYVTLHPYAQVRVKVVKQKI